MQEMTPQNREAIDKALDYMMAFVSDQDMNNTFFTYLNHVIGDNTAELYSHLAGLTAVTAFLIAKLNVQYPEHGDIRNTIEFLREVILSDGEK